MQSTKRLRLNRRRHLNWRPKWEPEIRGWAIKLIKRTSWRYDKVLYEFKDLVQEAYLVFLIVKAHYPTVREPAHFQALYQTALRNRLYDIAANETGRKAVLQALSHYPVAIDENKGYLNVLLSTAPEEVQRIVLAFDDENLLAKMRKPWSSLSDIAGVEPRHLNALRALLNA